MVGEVENTTRSKEVVTKEILKDCIIFEVKTNPPNLGITKVNANFANEPVENGHLTSKLVSIIP